MDEPSHYFSSFCTYIHHLTNVTNNPKIVLQGFPGTNFKKNHITALYTHVFIYRIGYYSTAMQIIDTQDNLYKTVFDEKKFLRWNKQTWKKSLKLTVHYLIIKDVTINKLYLCKKKKRKICS